MFAALTIFHTIAAVIAAAFLITLWIANSIWPAESESVNLQELRDQQ